ncbi:MAG TPA: hypothetical protein PKD90_07190 [Phnomibacter sp.]|nr:hypothetical protein [Phnomibacter sp.]
MRKVPARLISYSSARYWLWLVWIMLVNGMVNADYLLPNNVNTLALQQVNKPDDFDTIYEWVAEEIFGLEDAIPENNDTDDNEHNRANNKKPLKQIECWLPAIQNNGTCSYSAMFTIKHYLQKLPTAMGDREGPPPKVA